MKAQQRELADMLRAMLNTCAVNLDDQEEHDREVYDDARALLERIGPKAGDTVRFGPCSLELVPGDRVELARRRLKRAYEALQQMVNGAEDDGETGNLELLAKDVHEAAEIIESIAADLNRVRD